jgi:hypothetical protein
MPVVARCTSFLELATVASHVDRIRGADVVAWRQIVRRPIKREPASATISAQVNLFVKRPHMRSRTRWAHHDAFAIAGYSPIPGKRGVGSKLLDM